MFFFTLSLYDYICCTCVVANDCTVPLCQPIDRMVRAIVGLLTVYSSPDCLVHCMYVHYGIHAVGLWLAERERSSDCLYCTHVVNVMWRIFGDSMLINSSAVSHRHLY